MSSDLFSIVITIIYLGAIMILAAISTYLLVAPIASYVIK